jgi:hypothetical protein
MQEGSERPDDEEHAGSGETRPQRGGEGGTTRLGMEDGHNTDIHATGGPTSDDDTTSPDAQDLPEHP